MTHVPFRVDDNDNNNNNKWRIIDGLNMEKVGTGVEIASV